MGHLMTVLAKKNPLIKDGFNRADSNITMGNADTGQTWVATPNLWGISSSQARSMNTDLVDFAYIDIGKSDGKLSVSVVFSSNEGVAFRLTDVSNYLLARIGATSITLFKVVAAASTSLGTYAFTPVAGTAYAVKVIFNASSIVVYLDGILRITATETFNQTATRHGMRASASTAGRFDNFVLNPI